MKVTAKVVYKDETHRKIVAQYKCELEVYQCWIDEENKEMVDFAYCRLKAYLFALYMANCINFERLDYLEKELDKMRGWNF